MSRMPYPGEESGEMSPLVVSNIAARRLRFLHLDKGTSGDIQSQYGGSEDVDPKEDAGTRVAYRLKAAALSRPPPPPDTSGESWLEDRDESSEIPAGSLIWVETANATGPTDRRLARLMAASHGSGLERGVAHLAPLLAHNLGLRLHLDRLCAIEGATDFARGPQVSLRRCPLKDAGAEPRAGSIAVHAPGGTVHLPVAGSVQIAELRLPSVSFADLYGHAPPEPANGRGGDGGVPAVGAAGRAAAAAAAAAAEAEAPEASGPELPEDEDDVVEAVQAYFTSGKRVICVGDALAVAVPAGRGSGPQSLSGGVDVSRELLHLVVTAVAPGKGPCVFLPGRTGAVLQGRAPGPLPVGLEPFFGVPPAFAGTGGGGDRATSAPHEPLLPGIAGLLPLWRSLAGLLAPAFHPSNASLPIRVAALITGPEGSGKGTAVRAACAATGCHLVQLSCHALRPADGADQKALDALEAAFEATAEFGPTVLLLTHLDALADKGNAQQAAPIGARLGALARAHGVGQRAGSDKGPVFLVGSCPSTDDLPAPVRRCFTHTLEAEAPGLRDRERLLRGALAGATEGADFGEETIEEIAQHSGGLLPRELTNAVAEACKRAVAPVLPALLTEQGGVSSSARPAGPAAAAEPTLHEADLRAAMDTVRSRMASDIGAPKIPNVKWEDVGGLEDVKSNILDTVDLPLRHPELFTAGLRRRSGVLLYGPPGTGKTLLAKAVATECSINFMSVKGPELINMYIGESERQVREVFERARRASPCVVFFDELDSLAPARGRGSDSGGVMDRVVSQLLAEIDNAQGSGSVFLIGATNRPDLLDPALLRPGRLDKLLYVGIAREPESKAKVIEALVRKFELAGDVDVDAVARRCPSNYTGADVYALCSDAWMIAFRRLVREKGEAASDSSALGGELPKVVVGQSDFFSSLATLQPSLSEEEIAKYERIRDQYASETV